MYVQKFLLFEVCDSCKEYLLEKYGDSLRVAPTKKIYFREIYNVSDKICKKSLKLKKRILKQKSVREKELRKDLVERIKAYKTENPDASKFDVWHNLENNLEYHSFALLVSKNKIKFKKSI